MLFRSHGSAVVLKRDGHFSVQAIREPMEKKACSFERIYFSRGSDKDIYRERKELGRLLTPAILEAVDYDLRSEERRVGKECRSRWSPYH